jgi:alanine racemase
VADAVAAAPGLRLAGAWTHFATADEADRSFVAEQLAVYEPWARGVAARHPGVLLHAANSAAALAVPEARFDLVRCGIAIYGLDPFQGDPGEHGLEPALELRSYVAEVKRCRAGESAGYGRRWIAQRDTWLATIPIGYGDGVRRGLSDNAEVLVGGRRRPLVGTISMDNVTVDLGPDDDAVALRGTEAVLIGRQGQERILAEEVARRLGTINYEVTCGISARVPREHA